jgi:tRNA A37 threonylcarbamoyladenosine synthetase subunit TsaC/SUA5/YrdC
MPVLIGCWKQFYQLAQPISADLETWLRDVWGKSERPHTVVLKAADWIPDLFVKNGTIALRMVNIPYLAEAIAEVGAVTATSINLSGEPPLNDPQEIAEKFGKVCKYMLWGQTAGDVASVIVDISGGEQRIIRG